MRMPKRVLRWRLCLGPSSNDDLGDQSENKDQAAAGKMLLIPFGLQRKQMSIMAI